MKTAAQQCLTVCPNGMQAADFVCLGATLLAYANRKQLAWQLAAGPTASTRAGCCALAADLVRP